MQQNRISGHLLTVHLNLMEFKVLVVTAAKTSLKIVNCEWRAKLLFLFIKYAKFVVLPLPSRRRFYTPYLFDKLRTFYNKTESSV